MSIFAIVLFNETDFFFCEKKQCALGVSSAYTYTLAHQSYTQTDPKKTLSINKNKQNGFPFQCFINIFICVYEDNSKHNVDCLRWLLTIDLLILNINIVCVCVCNKIVGTFYTVFIHFHTTKCAIS